MGALLLGQLTNESAPHLHPLLDADVTGGPGLQLGPLGYILLPDDHLLHVLPLRLGLHTSRPVRINTDTREGGREYEPHKPHTRQLLYRLYESSLWRMKGEFIVRLEIVHTSTSPRNLPTSPADES